MHTVLYINEVSWIGGAEGALVDLATHLDSTVFRPVVVCPEEGEFPQVLRAQGVPVQTVPFHGLRARNPLRYFETIARLCSLVRSNGISLIHANHHYFANYGVVVGRICRVPVVVHVRGVESDGFFRSFARWIARADRVVCVSQAARNRLLDYARENLGERRAARLETASCVIYDGLRREDVNTDKEEVRAELGISPDAKVVGIVGQVTPEKGLGEFVEAARDVLKHRADVHFLVVGDDPDTARDFGNWIRRNVDDFDIGDKFTLTGFRRDAARMMAAMDVSVLASWQDAFPRTVLESMAAGVPAVATRVGGVPEMIEDSVSGLLVEPRDPSAIARGVLRVLAMTEHERRSMTARARERVARFSVEAHARQVQELYSSLVKHPGLEACLNEGA